MMENPSMLIIGRVGEECGAAGFGGASGGDGGVEGD
jgi:hypothetical protein